MEGHSAEGMAQGVWGTEQHCAQPEFRILSRGRVPPYLTTTGPTSEFGSPPSLPASKLSSLYAISYQLNQPNKLNKRNQLNQL
jgi:hypothetical protein